MDKEEAVLCYVDGSWAYFTTCQLDKQWGDDWNDAPYEHNAGAPYGWHENSKLPKYEIIKIAFDGNFETPDSICNGLNSPWSVELINAGAVAWLTQRYGKQKISILAGTSVTKFCDLIRTGGGSVYFRCEP